ncbi:peptidase C15, pyroglutamyl peptidase I-like protein [Acephala macrosclerotiorum]|nr:peptidase C15, pyroglutamyl peptidase I-like protein [Acephala macrosclerotiorum]
MGSNSEPTVLVTGFGEFLDIKTNPSWEIASHLPETINGARIITEPQPLKAIYHSLLEIPKLLEKENPDVVIHIGLAVDRDYFAIEKGAERDGYHQFPDEARKVFTRAETKEKWGKSPARLDSSFDIEEIVGKWKSHVYSGAGKGKTKNKMSELRASDDVGCYVCGFVYYASLEYYWKRDGSQGKRRVLFLHVPKLEGAEEIIRGRDITIDLIKAVSESL